MELCFGHRVQFLSECRRESNVLLSDFQSRWAIYQSWKRVESFECVRTLCVCFSGNGFNGFAPKCGPNALHFLGCKEFRFIAFNFRVTFTRNFYVSQNFSSLLKQQKFCPLAAFRLFPSFFLSFPPTFCLFSLLSLFLSFAKRIYCQKSTSCAGQMDGWGWA